MLPAAILVDQDGTIIDSEPIWEAVEAEMTRELGGVLTVEMRARMVGGPMSLTIDEIIAATGTDLEPDALEADLLDRFIAALSRHIPWMRGAANFIDTVGKAHIPLVLVTSSIRRIAESVVADAPTPGFTDLVAGDDVARHKPAPDAYLAAAAKLGVDISECLAIEDSTTGLAAAVEAGAVVVAVPGVVEVSASPDYSRLRGLDDLTVDMVERLMDGERIDLLD